MKKMFLLGFCILVLCSFSIFAGGEKESSTDSGSMEKAEPMVLKIGHYANADHAGNTACQMFADAVEKRTGGLLTFEIYPNNELGAPPEVLEQNILGAIDMSLPTQGQLGVYSDKFGCVMTPFAYESYEHAYAVLDGPFLEWAAPDLAAQGLIFLSNWEWGFRNLTNSVHPVVTPDDVVGLKIRTPPELTNQVAMEALGGIVQQIAFSELPMALQQGVVDGQENPVSVILAYKIYEYQTYLTMTGHTYNSMVHVMSKVTWDKLTSEQQEIIREESAKAGNWMRKTLQDAEAGQIAELEANGMEVVWPDKAIFIAKMQPAWDRCAEAYGKENMDTFLKMVEDMRP
jgi:tripartite ATP-independent transporter DctP family solute receptor